MKDFWNDPQRWEGIDDPHKDYFWCGPRKRDVIDVRKKKGPVFQARDTSLAEARYQQSFLKPSVESQRAFNSLQTYQPGGLIRYESNQINGLSNQRQHLSPLSGLFGGIL